MRTRSSHATRSLYETKYDEAETLQQRAERRQDMSLYEKAALTFSESLNIALDATVSSPQSAPPLTSFLANAHFGLAESLQSWGELLLETTSRVASDQLTAEIELRAAQKACSLFHDATIHYFHVGAMDSLEGRAMDGSHLLREKQEVGEMTTVGDARLSDPRSLRVDAAVNCGNTLASWAEALAGLQDRGNRGLTSEDAIGSVDEFQTASPIDLLKYSEECYLAAISKEEDTVTWSNFADALVQHGRLLCRAENRSEGFEMFERSHEAYGKACGLSSSENGDDLPG